MNRYLAITLCCLALSIPHMRGAKSLTVDCGDWVEISATPFDNYHFVEWSDGNTDSIRQIQVNEDLHYIAYFAANCGTFANLPVLALYDWLLMLNVRNVHDMGYHFSESDVTWYRVVGEPDDMSIPFPQDDQVVCQGYYLTLAQNLQGTGDYYAVVDVSSTPSGMLCTDWMRTVIIHYASRSAGPRLFLSPNYVAAGGQITLKGLLPNEQTHIYLYDAVGKLLYTGATQGTDQYVLQASYVAGCYQVVAESPSGHTTLRYVVFNQ